MRGELLTKTSLPRPEVLDHLDARNTYWVANVKFSTLFIGFSTLLLLQSRSLSGEQIPASELPPSGTDTGLEGKYDPQNGIAQVMRGDVKGIAIIFQDDHVVVFMPPDPVIAPG